MRLGTVTEASVELDQVASILVARGYQEVVTYSFIDTELNRKFTGSDSELTLSNPAFPNAVDASPDATATANAITSDPSANATGTASFARVVDGSGTLAIIDGNVGLSAADFILDSLSITAGQTVSMSSWVITEPEE